MNYTPLRVYVKLPPAASRALGKRAEQEGIDDPRFMAAKLICEGLGLEPFCSKCGRNLTMKNSNVCIDCFIWSEDSKES